MTQAIGKKSYSAIQFSRTGLIIMLPTPFVLARGVKKGDQFEALWSANSDIIVYKRMRNGSVERERLNKIARLQKEIEAIDEAREELRDNQTEEAKVQ